MRLSAQLCLPWAAAQQDCLSACPRTICRMPDSFPTGCKSMRRSPDELDLDCLGQAVIRLKYLCCFESPYGLPSHTSATRSVHNVSKMHAVIVQRRA